MPCKSAVNCHIRPNCGNGQGPHNGAPDIAGVGVVWGFGVTALVTLICAIPIVIVDSIELVSSQNRALRFISRVLFLKHLAKRPRLLHKIKEFVTHITLGLSDQQLLTGLAILVIGFASQCHLVNRHFWVVFDLAFFSSVTHMASLLALREYFCKYKRFRDLRVFLMVFNYILLLAATVLTFRNYNPNARFCPLSCTFERKGTRRYGASPIYTTQMLLLTIVFIWQLSMLYMKQETWQARHNFILKKIQPNNKNNNKQNSQNQRSWLKMAAIMLIAPPSAVVWIFVLVLWGLGLDRLLHDRAGAVGDENIWSFGQTLPILLLALPFFTVIEALQEGSDSNKPVSKTNEYEFVNLNENEQQQQRQQQHHNKHDDDDDDDDDNDDSDETPQNSFNHHRHHQQHQNSTEEGGEPPSTTSPIRQERRSMPIRRTHSSLSMEERMFSPTNG